MSKLKYHPLLDPFANAFANIAAGILGWRLLNEQEFEQLLTLRGENDRVALASEALKASKENVTFSFRKSVGPLVTGTTDHHRLLSLAAQQLVGHCWELLRQANLAPCPKEPVLEFFRHVRNGCFHGNAFHFRGGEPRNRAEWRGLIVTKNLHGQRIFRADLQDSDYFLNWGDPLLLLNDVSRLLPRT